MRPFGSSADCIGLYTRDMPLNRRFWVHLQYNALESGASPTSYPSSEDNWWGAITRSQTAST